MQQLLMQLSSRTRGGRPIRRQLTNPVLRSRLCSTPDHQCITFRTYELRYLSCRHPVANIHRLDASASTHSCYWHRRQRVGAGHQPFLSKLERDDVSNERDHERSNFYDDRRRGCFIVNGGWK